MIKIGPLMLQPNAEAIFDTKTLSVTARLDDGSRTYVALMHMTGADYKQLVLVANALDALEISGLEPYRDGIIERAQSYFAQLAAIDKAVSADAHRAALARVEQLERDVAELEHQIDRTDHVHAELKVQIADRTKERDGWERAYNQLNEIHNKRQPNSEPDSNHTLGLTDRNVKL